MARFPVVLAIAALLVGAAAGCGDDDNGGGSKPKTAAVAPPVGPNSSDEAVIRRWADLLRGRRVDEASDLFAVPATVANGYPPVRLDSRALVREFNESLPCGARVIQTNRKGRFTVATFLLLQRRDRRCGDGAGRRAATAFLIRNGKIVEWLRVPIPPEANPPGNPNAPSV